MNVLFLGVIAVCFMYITLSLSAAVSLPSAQSPEGYIARLIINEVPFPG